MELMDDILGMYGIHFYDSLFAAARLFEFLLEIFNYFGANIRGDISMLLYRWFQLRERTYILNFSPLQSARLHEKWFPCLGLLCRLLLNLHTF